MEITVRSKHVELTEAVRSAVAEKVSRLSRFLEGLERAEVAFTEERNPRIAEKECVEVTIHGHGHIVRAKASAPETLVAVDRVIDKLEHRLEKLKGRLLARSHPRRLGSVESSSRRASATSDGGIVDNDPDDDGQARIVKTKKFDMKPMTPEEAALQMELLGHDFFFFTNAETDRAAVVYQRNDGQIGLIDAT